MLPLRQPKMISFYSFWKYLHPSSCKCVISVFCWAMLMDFLMLLRHVWHYSILQPSRSHAVTWAGGFGCQTSHWSFSRHLQPSTRWRWQLTSRRAQSQSHSFSVLIRSASIIPRWFMTRVLSTRKMCRKLWELSGRVGTRQERRIWSNLRNCQVEETKQETRFAIASDKCCLIHPQKGMKN